MVDFSGNSYGLNRNSKPGYSSGYGSGHSQYGSYSDRKQSFNTGAGASSEKLMLQRMQEQKKRVERERAKQQLQDVQKKFEHNKIDISHRETEARRLGAESAHAEKELQEILSDLKALDEKDHVMKVKRADTEVQTERLEKEVFENRKEADRVAHRIKELELEFAKIQQELIVEKRNAYELGVKIQKALLQEKQSETETSKVSIENEHAKAEHKRKEIERDNKQKSFNLLKQRREYEIAEIQRLKAENAKLELEIRNLEQKAR